MQDQIPEKPLPPLLDEFRVALREEVDAAKRASSSAAIEIVGGRRVANLGDSVQYIFSIESPLNLPDDSPVELVIPGQTAPVEGTIVSVEGLTVVIAVPVNLGEYVPRARLQNDLTYLLRALIKRIEDLAEDANLAGERLLGYLPSSGDPIPANLSWLEFPPNDEQRDAVESGLGRDLTFIWGPPGTGKTQTIGTLSVELFRRERSVLLVSHTNAAVDQALLKVAKHSKRSELAQGLILRLGDPKDERVREKPDLLIKTHVERRSAELVGERDSLTEEIVHVATERSELERLINVAEWLPTAESDSRAWPWIIEQFNQIEAELLLIKERLEPLRAELAPLQAIHTDAERTVSEIARVAEIKNELPNLKALANEVNVDLQEAAVKRQAAEELAEQARLHVPELQAARERLTSIRAELPEREPLLAATDRELKDLNKSLLMARDLLERTVAANLFSRRLRGLPQPSQQQSIVSDLEVRSARLQAARQEAAERLERLQIDARVSQRIIDQYGHLPDLDRQEKEVCVCQRTEENAAKALANVKSRLDSAGRELAELGDPRRLFVRRYGVDPDSVCHRVDQLLSEMVPFATKEQELNEELSVRTTELRRSAEQHVVKARNLDLTGGGPDSALELVAAVRSGIERGHTLIADRAIDDLRAENKRLIERHAVLRARVDKLNEDLEEVEALVIAEAQVVATTLTRAYKRDSVQARKFDTVILDEASMAPIPALWVVAARAEHNVVLVGDFKQLPPIKHSGHPLADKWLGRDVFEAAGVKKEYEKGSAPAYCVSLEEQYRMHPEISAIANHFVYGGILRDGPQVRDDTLEFLAWFSGDAPFDAPVSLVDTSSLNAWVTSVNRGRRASRLNFLSATVCADLAQLSLRPGRDGLPAGANPRILVGAPYRPHAKLLSLLLRDQGLDGEVVAGTAHTFQGAEAPVVIFDLVNDEPHWRVAMFAVRHDENTRRLMNVALTRAQRRLIIVGDFSWIERQAARGGFLRELIAYLKSKYPIVDAASVVPAGLAARAAKADVSAASGHHTPSPPQLVVTQDSFYEHLYSDLANSHKRVVIYSPFATLDRVARLEPHLRAAIEQGVDVWVVTKPLEERGKDRGVYTSIEEGLRAWGVSVVHKRGMHEKLVLIDDDVLWQGSLNPLSFSSTQEIMERRKSKEVVADYLQVLRLAELLAAYEASETTCPYCGKEVVAAEGRDEPFYWRCVEDGCFSRSTGVPMPVDGRVVCRIDGGALEFRWPGDTPFWRCVENHRHRQPLARSHLRLPRMRELIPARDLRKLDRLYEMNSHPQQRNLLG